MAEIAKKRKENFSHNEVALLVSEVQVNSHLLFAKFDNQIDYKKKSEKWEDITLKINACGNHQIRTCGEVKKKWQDIKKGAKAKESIRRQHARGTGGGPPPKDLSEIEEKIISIIPDVVIDGISGGLDTAETDSAAWIGSEIEKATTSEDVETADIADDIQSEQTEQLVPATVVHQAVPTTIKMRDELKRKRERIDDSFLKLEHEKIEVEREKVEVLKGIRASLAELVSLKRQELLSSCDTVMPIIEL